MISIALSTHDLIVTVTDTAGTAVTGATVTMTGRKAGADVVAEGVAWPVALQDQNDGTYTWRYPDSFRVALGTAGKWTAVIDAVKATVHRHAEVKFTIAMDTD